MLDETFMDVARIAVPDEINQTRVQFDFAGSIRCGGPVATEDYDHVLRQAFPYLNCQFVAGVARHGAMEIEVD